MSVRRPDAATHTNGDAPRLAREGAAAARRVTTLAAEGLRLADEAAERRDAYDAAYRAGDFALADRCLRQSTRLDQQSHLALIDLAELVIEGN